MCVVLLAWRHAPDHKLLLAGNRDEFHARPSAGLSWWPGASLLAGRDLEAGGTWMALTRGGRFALVTNVRGRDGDRDHPTPENPISRGLLVAAFCGSNATPETFATDLAASDAHYAGYNLLISDGETLVCHSNRYGTTQVQPGVHGLSNADLNAPWPKTSRGMAGLQSDLSADDTALFRLLADDQPAADESLPDTGVGLSWERKLSSLFVAAGDYGTRASSIVRVRNDGRCSISERRFDSAGTVSGTHTEQFDTVSESAA
jgi:uncharacterized protein with NRDE domain